jgi:hypothetical protein
VQGLGLSVWQSAGKLSQTAWWKQGLGQGLPELRRQELDLPAKRLRELPLRAPCDGEASREPT